MAFVFQTTRFVVVAVVLGNLMSISSPLAAFAETNQPSQGAESPVDASAIAQPIVYHKTTNIDGLDIFYREAGPKNAPTVLLLHGFPTSSHMFRNLIPVLADRYHVVAPDYPGYGNSSMPRVDQFDYTFDNMADIVEKLTVELGLEKYSIYLMDYGAPVGFRLAVRHPQRIETLIIQNGNAYEEGLREFWKPLRAYWNDRSTENGDALRSLLTIDATKWQYTHGVRNAERISPDNWNVDQRLLDRPGNQEIQLAMFYDYGIDVWAKELAPSDELRKWFDHEDERFEQFTRRYRLELESTTAVIECLLSSVGDGTVTLLYAARNTTSNHAMVLRSCLEQMWS